MEIEERHDRTKEVFDVFSLSFLSSASVCFLTFGMGFRGPLGIQFRTKPINRAGRRPNAFGEGSSPSLLLNDPMISSGLHSTGQCGIAGREQSPAFGNSQDFAIAGFYRAWCSAGRNSVFAHSSPCDVPRNAPPLRSRDPPALRSPQSDLGRRSIVVCAVQIVYDIGVRSATSTTSRERR